ncbi:DUF805 domain-containing protein [Proteus hauseri]|uniref:DUF805 domain-containing protein n=1 Tax=Proteus hauseri TaxID=183417 RepID=UPI0032DB122E
MKWYFLALKNYFNFSGRARRKEYWMFTLINIIIFMFFMISIVGLREKGESSPVSTAGLTLIVFYYLFTIIPSLSLCVRRFHDQDRSGWFVLLLLIPSLGPLIVFVFMCIEGTKGKNRFGSDPKLSNF